MLFFKESNPLWKDLLIGCGLGVIIALIVMGITWNAYSEPDHIAKPKCQDGSELIASMEEGKVNVYRVTSCIYYEGTDILARRHICYVTVGELHGKTVAMECYQ